MEKPFGETKFGQPGSSVQNDLPTGTQVHLAGAPSRHVLTSTFEKGLVAVISKVRQVVNVSTGYRYCDCCIVTKFTAVTAHSHSLMWFTMCKVPLIARMWAKEAIKQPSGMIAVSTTNLIGPGYIDSSYRSERNGHLPLKLL